MASITVEYKKSAEYQNWKSHILADSPNLPEYLIDMAIAFHLENPLAYRDKKLNRPMPPVKKAPSYVEVEGAVGVHDSVPDLPSVKIIE